MKKTYWLFLPLLVVPVFLFSCAGPPTLAKSGTTDTLTITLASGSGSATGSGGFYDYSQPSTLISGGVTTINSYTETTFSIPGGPWSFTDQSHDTLGFSVTFTSGPVTFGYQLNTISGNAVANPTFTSGRISF